MRLHLVAAGLAALVLSACTSAEMGAFADAMAIANGGYYENYQSSQSLACPGGGRVEWTYGISDNMSYNYAYNASGYMVDIRFNDADGEGYFMTIAPGETSDTAWFSPSADGGNVEFRCY